MTRAKEQLILSYARDYGGARGRRPSIFLQELDLTNNLPERQLDSTRVFELVREVEALSEPPQELTTIGRSLSANRFSFSQLEGYDHCPLQYKFNFILKVPVPDKANIIYGRLMHHCLYEIFLPCLKSSSTVDLFGQSATPKYLNWPDWLNIYKKNWVDEGYNSAEEREQYYKLGEQSLRLIWQKVQDEGWPKVLGLEKQFVWKGRDFTLKGTIDRIDQLPDGRVEIIDYKTGQPKESLDYKTKRQLILYKMVAEEMFGWQVGRLTFGYLNDGSFLSFEAKASDIDKVQREIVTTIKAIKQGLFPAKPSWLCNYCDFRSICQFRQV